MFPRLFAASSRRDRRRPVLELLEGRQLLSATVQITDSVAPDDDDQITFGEVRLTRSSDVENFRISNTGDEVLHLTNRAVGGDAGDFEAVFKDSDGNVIAGETVNISPNTTYTLEVTFNPQALGTRAAEITADTDDPAAPQISLAVSGDGIAEGPQIAISDTVEPSDDEELPMGDVQIGDSSGAQSFELNNEGDETLEISALALDGDNASEFSLQVLDNNNDPVVGDSFSIAPAQTYTLVVTFSPTGAGTREATLSMTSNDTDAEQQNIALSLSGTGIEDPNGAPVTPENFSADPLSSRTIELSWDDSSQIESGYKIYEATSVGGPFTLIQTTAADATSYRRTLRSVNTAYWYRIVAFNDNGSSDAAEDNARTYNETAGPTAAAGYNLGKLVGLRARRDHVGPGDYKDYYRFSLPLTSTVRVTLSELADDVDVKLLKLYSSGSTTVLGTSTNWGRNNELITKKLTAGTYAVVCYQGDTDVSSAYRMAVEADFAGNTRGAARNVGTIGSTTKTYNDWVGNNDQDDYYKLTLASSGVLALNLSGLSGDADLELLRSDGTLIRKSINDGTASESISRLLSAGTYYVRVMYYGQSNYKLTMSKA